MDREPRGRHGLAASPLGPRPTTIGVVNPIRSVGLTARAIRNVADRLLYLAVQLPKKNQLYDIGLRQLAPEAATAI